MALAFRALMSENFFSHAQLREGEYYCLAVCSILGMCVMTSAGDLIVFYLGLGPMPPPVMMPWLICPLLETGKRCPPWLLLWPLCWQAWVLGWQPRPFTCGVQTCTKVRPLPRRLYVGGGQNGQLHRVCARAGHGLDAAGRSVARGVGLNGRVDNASWQYCRGNAN